MAWLKVAVAAALLPGSSAAEASSRACAGAPCTNGDCFVGVDGNFACECPHGWSGNRCQHDVDDCSSQPCLNGGACEDRIDAHVCTCPVGFSGRTCSIDYDECTSHPCRHGGRCTEVLSHSYQCDCANGWGGENCDVETNECESSPCAHGTCSDQSGSYYCRCDAGWRGINCNHDKDECASAPCRQRTGHHDCTQDQPDSYSCVCSAGWTGAMCITDVDDCASAPCAAGRTRCEDGADTYTCVDIAADVDADADTDAENGNARPVPSGKEECWVDLIGLGDGGDLFAGLFNRLCQDSLWAGLMLYYIIVGSLLIAMWVVHLCLFLLGSRCKICGCMWGCKFPRAIAERIANIPVARASLCVASIPFIGLPLCLPCYLMYRGPTIEKDYHQLDQPSNAHSPIPPSELGLPGQLPACMGCTQWFCKCLCCHSLWLFLEQQPPPPCQKRPTEPEGEDVEAAVDHMQDVIESIETLMASPRIKPGDFRLSVAEQSPSVRVRRNSYTPHTLSPQEKLKPESISSRAVVPMRSRLPPADTDERSPMMFADLESPSEVTRGVFSPTPERKGALEKVSVDQLVGVEGFLQEMGVAGGEAEPEREQKIDLRIRAALAEMLKGDPGVGLKTALRQLREKFPESNLPEEHVLREVIAELQGSDDVLNTSI